MRICMVTPHLPPEQAANALLPQLLGEELVRIGHQVSYVAFHPRQGLPQTNGAIFYIRLPRRGGGLAAKLRFPQLATALEVFLKAREVLSRADVVHVHSNTFMNQVSAALAHARGRPFILTHYGTEIWHRQESRNPFDLFRWMNRRAAHVTYYSRRLLEHSLKLGVAGRDHSVVYPPVDSCFRFFSPAERGEARQSLGIGQEPLLLNVKRLHPLAGQRYLIEAMPELIRQFPRARLWIAGEGDSRAPLAAAVDRLGLGSSVKLLGLVDHRDLPRYYAAADVFVLPSLLEAFPTVAAEALACGTPVVSADHPGGLELKELFPNDVGVVPREAPAALARELGARLASPARTSTATSSRIEAEFRPASVLERYLSLYRQAAGRAGGDVA